MTITGYRYTMRTEMIQIKLTKEEKEKVKAIAKETGIQPAPFIRVLLLKELKKNESTDKGN